MPWSVWPRSYDSECDRVGKDLAIAESQFRDYQARLGKPFEHQDYLTKLAALRDQLKSALSGTSPEEDGEPSITDLAGQIKALRGA